MRKNWTINDTGWIKKNNKNSRKMDCSESASSTGRKTRSTPSSPFRTLLSFAVFAITAAFLVSCGSLEGTRDTLTGVTLSGRSEKQIRELLVEGASVYRGAAALSVGSRSFNMDCSGLVSAIYWYAGIDLQKYYGEYTGTGTERIYKTLSDRELLDRSWMPEPGDIIFWDNTFDKNSNGIVDDELTHIGMVVSVDRKGNIVYIHHHSGRGIVYENMNLRYKNYHLLQGRGKSVVLNSPMRDKPAAGSRKKWLSGQLFSSFGRGCFLE